MKEKRIVYPVLEEIKSHKDIIYKSVRNVPLTLDVFTPVNKANTPVVLLVHGGPVKASDIKDWGVFQSWGELIASKGLACAVINHRFNDAKSYEVAESDIKDAVAFIRLKSKDYNIDSDRIMLFAFSGAGSLISFSYKGEYDYIKGLIYYYALLELSNKRLNDQFSAVKALSSLNRPLPIMIAKVGLDRKNINASVDKFMNVADELQINYQWEYHPTGKHGFDVLNDDETTRQIIENTLKFMKENL